MKLKWLWQLAKVLPLPIKLIVFKDNGRQYVIYSDIAYSRRKKKYHTSLWDSDVWFEPKEVYLASGWLPIPILSVRSADPYVVNLNFKEANTNGSD